MEERLADAAQAAGDVGMIVLATDIVTLFRLRPKRAADRAGRGGKSKEELAITLITRMEILQGRFASLMKAANERNDEGFGAVSQVGGAAWLLFYWT
ncbi:MAG: hypothetical protein U0797_01800 [Gemmataceae bacterium]